MSPPETLFFVSLCGNSQLTRWKKDKKPFEEREKKDIREKVKGDFRCDNGAD